MATSESALPRPLTLLSSFSAAALLRWVSASTDASNSEARAEADEAAAEAEPLAELIAAEAEDARAGGGVPANDEAFGVLVVPAGGEVAAL
ncbi:hypothetical protein ACIGXF_14745 [Streptomyces sp. NPDC053086]|uniref:hypothetical protein n=1 Tax=unclassified Streptomyces TaxID=2593676 RepID=UPI0036F8F0A4